ncbi:MAG TPA: choice-of-anchor Q domain-containing protein [Terriglobales bacterium]
MSGAGLYSIFILESGASLNISGLTLAHAQGTAIDFGATGSLMVTNCAFVDNASTGNGAAIDTIAPATVTGSTFQGNSVSGNGGAITTTANLTVVNSTFWNNSTAHGSGGAIMVYAGAASLNVSLTNDTFAGNSSASDGGAVLFQPAAGTLTADNDIFSNNSAASNGGGISSYAGATANIADAIYWNNVSATSPDCYACTTNGGVDVASNPLTLPLALYGGTTPTLLPQPGSAAICAESALEATSAGLTSDQRGFSIASTCANGGIDVGAVQTNYLTVNNSTETLAAALTAANSAGKQDIDFDASLSSITLSSALPAITGQVNLIGPGAASLIISGANSATVGTLISVNAGAEAAVSGLTLASAWSTNAATGGGAVYNAGTLTLNACSIIANEQAGEGVGGGIENDSGGTLTMTGCTVYGNHAQGSRGIGGGLVNEGTASISYSTFFNNTAIGGATQGGTGGAIDNDGTLTITASTIDGNSATDPSSAGSGGGGGIFNGSTAKLTLSNTIVAANTSTDAGPDGSGTFTDGGSNLIGDGTAMTGLSTGVNGDLVGTTATPVAADLAAFGWNGGPTTTLLPLPGSPAICAGAAANVPVDISTDQRGFANINKTYTGHTASPYCVDIGAVQTNYQSMQFTASSYTASPNQAVSPVPVVTVTENGQSIGGVPVTLTFTGTGTATGLGPVTTGYRTGASFGSLAVSADGADTLSAAVVTVVGSDTLAASSVPLTVGAATTINIVVSPLTAAYGTTQNYTATVTSGGSPVTSGTVTISDSALGGGTLVSASVDANGQVTSGSYLKAGTHNLTATYTPAVGYLGSYATTPAFSVAQAPLTITASNGSMTVASPAPTITPIYSGFVAGDIFDSLTTFPTCSANTTTRVTSCSGAVDPNYTITYVPGTLTITSTLYVTTPDDSSGATDCDVSSNSDCSLRSAITQANLDASNDTITFPDVGSPAGITLTSALPTVTTSMTIQGPGARLFTISAAGYSALSANAGTLAISGLTFTGSRGAIDFAGAALTVTGSAFVSNAGPANGAAIASTAPVTVSASTFLGNSATSGNGGAIGVQAGLTVTNSTFVDNSSAGGGGGAIIIMGAGGAVTLTNNTFENNSAGTDGGAVLVAASGATLTALNNLFVGNSASGSGAAIEGSGTTNVANSVYWHNLAQGAESDCSSCTTNTNAVSATANPLTLPLALYGGTTETVLPQPASAAICAGASAGAPATDQRGFPVVATCVDAGADQTNYLTVNGSETLTAALNAANTAGKQDIDFDSSLDGTTIALTSALPQITAQVNLIGPGANQLAISGGGSITVGALLQIAASTESVIADLTLENGLNATANAGGGAIDSLSPVTVIGCAILNNAVTGTTQGVGGGLYSTVGATVLDSTFSGNKASGPQAGGGAIAAAETLTIANSTFSGNNVSTAGTGFAVGGAIYTSGVLSLNNSTVAGNSASGTGTTVEGGGIVTPLGASTLDNSIVAANTDVAGYPDVYGRLTGSQNLIGVGSAILGLTNGASGNLVGTAASPLAAALAPLASNGGPTQTMLPLPGSAAICAGAPAGLMLASTTDQRGFVNTNTTYTGYSSSSPCVDMGAVQTNYQTIQFASTSLGAAAGGALSPAPVVSVTENGQSVGGVPVTLSFTGTGTATGLGPVTTAAGTGATFSNLAVSAAGSDTLTAALTIVGSDTITTTPAAALTVGLTAVQVALNPATAVYGTPQTVTATTTVGGVALTSGTVTFTDADGATLPANVSLSGSGRAAATVTLAPGAHNITATYNPAGGYQTSSASTGAFTVGLAPLAISAHDASSTYGATTLPSFSGTVTGAVNGDTFTETFSTSATAKSAAGTYAIVPHVTGNATGANLADYTVTATDGTLTIAPAAQTVTFATIPTQAFSTAPLTLTATASSGLPVSFALVSGPATLSGASLTLTGGGAVTVTASQAGNANYQAATAVTQSFLVSTAIVQVAPATLSFGGELTSTTSAAQSVTIANRGASALSVAAAISGDASFAVSSNTCGTSLAAGANCTVQVTFAPKAAASASGTLTITSNTIPASAPLTNEVTLSGTGEDLVLQPGGGSVSSPTVTPGQTAQFSLTVTPAGGLTGSVPLTCSVLPATNVTCTVTPSPLVVSGATPQTVTIVVTTTAAAAAPLALPNAPSIPSMPSAPWQPWEYWLLALITLLAAATLANRRRRALAVSVFAAALVLAACGGQVSSNQSTSSATPAGAYTLTVTAAAAGGDRTAQFTFTVQ